MRYSKIFPDFFKADETLQIVGGAPKAAIGCSINMLVWNIYKGRNKTWHDDFLTLAKDKDFVLLQESILNTGYDDTFRNPSWFEWVMARSHKNKTTLIETGVKTGAVVKSQTQNFLISPDTEPVFKTPKMMLATTYSIEGSDRMLLVVNVHAINFVSYKKYVRNIDQIIQIVGQHTGPIILAGDFNSWGRGRYRKLTEMTMGMGLSEVTLARKGRWQHFNQHLDHVFYRGMELQSAEVLFNVRSSDHYPITAKFSL